MSETSNGVLVRMLERLFAAIVSGPCMNCRPQSSRQRIDLTHLAALQDIPPEQVLAMLLSDEAEVAIRARTARPPGTGATTAEEVETGDGERSESRRAWLRQQQVVQKLRIIADESMEYENDTGVHALALGFPLLSVPQSGGSGVIGARRVLAPVAMIPVSVEITGGATPQVRLSCRAEDADRVQPNEALLAWLEQQTGKKSPALFSDAEGSDPWREIGEIVRFVCSALEIEPCTGLAPAQGSEWPTLPSAPSGEEQDRSETPSIVRAAVLGLFPLANQGLLRDTQAMLGGEETKGPVESFLRAGSRLEEPAQAQSGEAPRSHMRRSIEDERLVTNADPFQSRAVRLARTCASLVVHGPPGTGKSQTITNIIGDHLSRGQRVLFVCDKRTALDVVADRLEQLGLGGLCAVTHDPQRDPRDLMKSIREQIESLAETQPPVGSEVELAKVDAELVRLQQELETCRQGIMAPGPNGEPSLHELVGMWLECGGMAKGVGTTSPESGGAVMDGVSLADLAASMLEVEDGLTRARAVELPNNPWSRAVGVSLDELLRTPMPPLRQSLMACMQAGEEADRLIEPEMPGFAAEGDLSGQGAKRAELGEALMRAATVAAAEVRARWGVMKPETASRHRTAMRDVGGAWELMKDSGAPDAELMMVARSQATPISAASIALQLGTLEQYLVSARKLLGFLAFGAKKRAAETLRGYGLGLTTDAAERVARFLARLRAGMLLRGVVAGIEERAVPAGLPDLEETVREYRGHEAVAAVLGLVEADPERASLGTAIREGLTGVRDLKVTAEALKRSPARATALSKLEHAAAACRLIDRAWVARHSASWRRGHRAADELGLLVAKLPTLEDVLRCGAIVKGLGSGLGEALRDEMMSGATPEEGLVGLRRRVAAADIQRRLEADTGLRGMDGRRIEAVFARFEQLEAQKLVLVRDAARSRWVTTQRQRLLTSTGSRLNGLGASTKQRLFVRGARALKLRQVIALGQEIEGGDPLLDLRPVWMVSPETAAQVFPRKALFDIVIFDEASQCRLEEALPVLTRGKRVVIAGDPRQLPPTRFFESAVAVSDNDAIETDQDLFESQQSQAEDLLTAALNLDSQQCYLDVHYRSRNSDLIAFSNAQFYSSRLVPIPGHPRNRAKFPPLSLQRVQGIYHQRTNEQEADRVIGIVKDLLRRAQPPSIGIACFNIAQRDLLNRRLEEAALGDEEFATGLAAARMRRGHAGFEGLFVKNLENVQGDERDHIIISTTYGPDKAGKFYRRFGPLGLAGGGRRLNVLITRARHEVHLVTSIPPEVYRSLPPVPVGQSPTGGWLLLSYLQFAERLEALYREEREVGGKAAEGSDDTAVLSEPTARVGASQTPSRFAAGVAGALAARHRISSQVHWGNDGFCIDAALDHPKREDDVTIGVLCDFSRFEQAEDPIEWDMFRGRVLRGQGWTLHRLWTPAFMRDPEGRIDEVAMRAAEEATTRDDPESLRVEV